MKKFFFVVLLALFASLLSAQKYFTKSGTISFESTAVKMEKIEAINNKATAVYDAASGAIEYGVLIKAFSFDKALMQEHFNENYLESTKFPKATFKGKVVNAAAVNLAKDGTYTADVEGKLTMHGVTKDVKTKATFVVKGGKISASTSFKVLLADYAISIPSVVKDNVSKEMNIEVKNSFELLK
jgi:polyisoprenoid-binding protein YceI